MGFFCCCSCSCFVIITITLTLIAINFKKISLKQNKKKTKINRYDDFKIDKIKYTKL